MRKEIIGLLAVSVLYSAISLWLSPGNPKIFVSVLKIGDLGYNLAMAYIASFVFYYLVVFLPDQRNKKNISPYIEIKTNAIFGKANTTFEHIRQVWNHELKIENASADDLERILAYINPHEKAPMVHPDGSGGLRPATWIEYFTSAIRETRNAEEKILSHATYMDAGIIKRTRAVTGCLLFSTFELQSSVRCKNTDMCAWGPQIFEWMSLCLELKKYADRELSPYLKL